MAQATGNSILFYRLYPSSLLLFWDNSDRDLKNAYFKAMAESLIAQTEMCKHLFKSCAYITCGQQSTPARPDQSQSGRALQMYKENGVITGNVDLGTLIYHGQTSAKIIQVSPALQNSLSPVSETPIISSITCKYYSPGTSDQLQA